MVQGLVQIYEHDHARLARYAKRRYVAHPDRNAEVVSEKPLEDEASCQRVDCGKNEDCGLGNGVKYHVEQQEDDTENDWQDQLQPLFRPQLKFVFAGPFVRVAGRQREFLAKQIICAGDKAAVILRVQIDVYISISNCSGRLRHPIRIRPALEEATLRDKSSTARRFSVQWRFPV